MVGVLVAWQQPGTCSRWVSFHLSAPEEVGGGGGGGRADDRPPPAGVCLKKTIDQNYNNLNNLKRLSGHIICRVTQRGWCYFCL